MAQDFSDGYRVGYNHGLEQAAQVMEQKGEYTLGLMRWMFLELAKEIRDNKE